MKKILLTALFVLTIVQSHAQVKWNPQFGLTFQSLTNATATPRNFSTVVKSDFNARAGFITGTDVRLGRRFYLQPGLFFMKNTILQKLKGDTITFQDFENKIYQTSVRLKANIGVDLVHQEGFKIRINGGTSYDLILNTELSDPYGEIVQSDNYKKGAFNINGAVGVDVWFLSGELGYCYGISNAYKDNAGFNINSKYTMVYISAGIVIGKDKKSKKKKDDDDRK